MGVPAIAGIFFFAGYMAWRECKLKSTLTEQALQGNQNAMAIMTKCHKPWTMDEKIVYEAINGNRFALEILGIKNQQVK